MSNVRKRLYIIAHFTMIDEPNDNGRFTYIANMLNKKYDVTLITSDFSHVKKKKRQKDNIDKTFKVILAHEPPYKKNVSISRLKSHKIFGDNVKSILSTIEKPDLIYCAIPSLDVGYAAAQFCNNKKIPFIIDVQDIWPEAFRLIFNFPIFNQIVYNPMYRKANYIYQSADQIIAVSETYADLALEHNKKVREGYSIYLGTDLNKFDSIVRNSVLKKNENEFLITYIGTLGHSYNIECIIDTIYDCNKEGIGNIFFLVMGDGPLKKKFENYAQNKGVNVRFAGMLQYNEMVKKLVVSDIAVNPICKGAAASIINKVGDYAAAGLPVINTQENEEYRNAVDSYGFGINCDNNDIMGLKDAILKLYNDKKLREEMGKNNRNFAEEKFDRSSTYPKILDIVDGLL